MAGKFDPEKFLTEDENEEFANKLLEHPDENLQMVLKLVFPEKYDTIDDRELDAYEKWFLDTYDVHECESCLKWIYDDELEDKVCADCLEEQDEDDDDDYDGDDEDDEEELEEEEKE